VSEALKTADHVLEGGIHIGGQEHFYLETQACLVVPKEDGEMEIFSSTQHPTSIQVVSCPIHATSCSTPLPLLAILVLYSMKFTF